MSEPGPEVLHELVRCKACQRVVESCRCEGVVRYTVWTICLACMGKG